MRKAIAILILSGIVFIASACGAASTVPEASADRNEVSDSQSAEVPEPEPEAEPAKLEDLDGLEAGTVLDAAQLDLTDPARYFTGTAIAEGIRCMSGSTAGPIVIIPISVWKSSVI